MPLLIKNVAIVDAETGQDILVEDGLIKKIGESLDESASEIIDGTGLVALPGVIDVHVHFRVPGGEADESKEDWQHGSAAALAGGVTTVLDMPNNSPAITTYSQLRNKVTAIDKKTNINFGCYIAATNDNLEEVKKSADLARGVKVYYGTTTGDIVMSDLSVLKELFNSGLRMPIVIHAEDDSIINAASAELKEYKGFDIHGKVRPREAATKALQDILAIAEDSNPQLHITHVSTQEEVEMIRQAKSAGLDISCDVTPHHLAFSEEDIRDKGHLLRINPPLRKQDDRKALWEGLIDGTIDMVASDHAPHLLSEKQADNYWDVPSGVPGVETLLPFLLDNVSDDFSLARLVEVTASMPAERFEWTDRGGIDVGKVADIVLVDRSGKTAILNVEMKSKCAWSPWDGQELSGAIKYVISGGQVVK